MIYKTLEETSEVSVSHNPEIKKKVLIANGQIPHLTQFSRVKFPPGEMVQAHTHPDMYEIYRVESGEGVMVITGKKDLLMTMVGITVDFI